MPWLLHYLLNLLQPRIILYVSCATRVFLGNRTCNSTEEGTICPGSSRKRQIRRCRRRCTSAPKSVVRAHHDPARALGDLTGIKKHFSRKHGEKNFSCTRCHKRYAVLSDLKAHSKICGTTEYKCECGTTFYV